MEPKNGELKVKKLAWYEHSEKGLLIVIIAEFFEGAWTFFQFDSFLGRQILPSTHALKHKAEFDSLWP
jgi:hypothetical protein